MGSQKSGKKQLEEGVLIFSRDGKEGSEGRGIVCVLGSFEKETILVVFNRHRLDSMDVQI